MKHWEREERIGLFIFGMTVFGLLMVIVFMAFHKQPDCVLQEEVQGVEVQDLTVNQKFELYLEDRGYPVLARSNELQHSAYVRAEEMAAGDIPWAHDGFEDHIKKYYGNNDRAGYFWAGEALARDFADFDAVLVAWDNSPTHKDVMVSPLACEYGIAHVGEYWVLHDGCKYEY